MNWRILIPYLAAVFLSASLVFLIQPLFARLLLPEFGGVPAVWNTCTVFFQTILLFGYCYTWATTHWLTPRRQILLHCALLLATLALLPVGLPESVANDGESSPILKLIGLLLVSLGGPYFAVSTTTPLLQQWFSGTKHRHAADPYFLYAVSNAGSILGLLAYPFAVERLLNLDSQRMLWTGGYGTLIVLTIGCGLIRYRSINLKSATSENTTVGDDSAPSTGQAANTPDRQQRIRWTLMAFLPSAMLLAVTTRITTDVASVPLLWVIPLTIYLATYINAFARRPVVTVERASSLFLPTVFVLALYSQSNAADPVRASVELWMFILIAVVFHGRLAHERPPTKYLAEYYFWLALGGCLGGMLVGIAGPVLFPAMLELPITAVLAVFLFGIPDSDKEESKGRLWLKGALLILFAVAGVRYRVLAYITLVAEPVAILFEIVGFVLMSWSFWRRSGKGFSVALSLVLLPSLLVPRADVILRDRTFFGEIAVRGLNVETDDGAQYVLHRLSHGTTVHGEQLIEPEESRCVPRTYYVNGSPLSQAMQLPVADGKGRRVAVVGLGAGAMMCFSRDGDEFEFFEIDPVIRDIASDRKLFRYLTCGGGRATITVGDGRLELGRKPEASFDVIAIDAFSSDSIPVHLMTAEALDIYMSRLAEGGVLVLHISNRFVDLEPVAGRYAKERGLVSFTHNMTRLTPKMRQDGGVPSTVVIMARSGEELSPVSDRAGWVTTRSNASLWTDQHASLLEQVDLFPEVPRAAANQ